MPEILPVIFRDPASDLSGSSDSEQLYEAALRSAWPPVTPGDAGLVETAAAPGDLRLRQARAGDVGREAMCAGVRAVGLVELQLESNRLTGTLPEEIHRLTGLAFLGLVYGNQKVCLDKSSKGELPAAYKKFNLTFRENDYLNNKITCTDHDFCMGHGWFSNASQTCVCDAGFIGSDCSLSNRTSCSGQGSVNPDGTCDCAGASKPPLGLGRDGSSADISGERCQYTNDTCSDNGAIARTSSGEWRCVCDAGSMGDRCQFSPEATCGGHATNVSKDGDCTCEPAWAGTPSCSMCVRGAWGPQCLPCPGGVATPCTNESYVIGGTCDGGGTMDPKATGKCHCVTGDLGEACQWSNKRTCHNVGHVILQGPLNGTCICNRGYNGFHCEYSDVADCTSSIAGSVQ
eukprot:gene11721-13839_t